MKLTKKVFALVMVLAILVGCVSATAFAADENEVATFAGSSKIYVWSNTYGRNYNVYQIFYGDQAVSADGTSNKSLANVQWGVSLVGKKNGVSYDLTENFIDELTDESNTALYGVFGNLASYTAETIISALSSQTDDSNVMVAFAQAIADTIGDTNVEFMRTADSTVAAGGGYDAILTGVHQGYYMIVDNSMDTGEDGTSNYDPDGTQNASKDASKYSYSRILLKVVGASATANEKIAAVPSLKKEIDVSDDHKDAGATSQYDFASIGETRGFTLTSNVPDMTGYNKYYFILNDTLSKGLTFDPDSLIVKVGSTTLKDKSKPLAYGDNADQTYTLETTENDDGSTTINIIFTNFLQYQGRSGDEAKVVVKYNAELNEDAVIGATGNTNVATLTYSNNPNYTYEGDPENPDKPAANETPANTEDTVEHTVYIYTTNLEIIKTDSSSNRLTGASFRIAPKVFDDDTVNVAIVKKLVTASETYTPNRYLVSGNGLPGSTAGEYVQMDNGAFTATSEVTTENISGALDVNVKYNENDEASLTGGYYKLTDAEDISENGGTLVAITDKTDMTKNYQKGIIIYTQTSNSPTATIITDPDDDDYNETTWEAAVGTNGTLDFRGLGAGTYLITETVSPAGYNILTEPIEVKITFQAPTTAETTATWSVTFGDANAVTGISEFKGSNTIEVKNAKGAELPETGGIGTTIFYTVGSILVVAAVVLLITKRRMRNVNY